jgi:hypothetical protein
MELVTVSTVLVPATAAYNGQQPHDLVALSAITQELRDCDTRLYPAILTWITQASAAASKFCNRSGFQVETIQDQVFPPRDYFPAPTVIGGVKPLQLSRWPIATTPSLAGTAPPIAPTLSQTPGGSLSAATYYVKVTYVTPTGETAASQESLLSVAADNLLMVAGPIQDQAANATGWNCYIGNTSWGETKQNSTPLAIGAPFVLPGSGLIDGAEFPSYVLAIENNRPLCEGTDFIAKKTEGQLIRLDTNGWPKHWPALITLVQYPGGFDVTGPEYADLADAATRMVRDRYFSRDRDARLRQESTAGVYDATYWFASGPGAATGNLTPDVEAILEKYRVPVCG